jgi:broad specificity phosphatase PhoE
MKEEIRGSAGSAQARVHREWQPCDRRIVEAWISGRYGDEGESWEQFQKRISACLEKMCQLPDDWHSAIFTSATPIGIWGGLTLDVFDERSLRLAGVVHNSSYSLFRERGGQLRMLTFNATPHLGDSSLRTHR